MNSRPAFFDTLRHRSDLTVDEEANRWLIRISKGSLTCEVVVSKKVFEWFVSVKRSGLEEELWSDWEDYYGSSPDQLEEQMVKGVAGLLSEP